MNKEAMNKEEIVVRVIDHSNKFLSGLITAEEFKNLLVSDVGEWEGSLPFMVGTDTRDGETAMWCDIILGEDDVLHSFKIEQSGYDALVEVGAEEF